MNDLNSNSSTRSAMNAQSYDLTKPLEIQAMSDKIFYRFSTFIHDELGIKMPEAKKTILQVRLQKRLRNLEISSFKEYYDYVFSSRGLKDELANMIDVVTTNKTDFFREPDHFDFLVQKILPRIIRRGRTGLISTESNYRRIAYDYVKREVNESERPEHFDRVLRDAKVRMPGKKAGWLVSNLDRIESCGGVTEANRIAFSIRGRTEKIRFMKAFDGIGDKYGRNIWMDIYDKDFYESVAVDERIKKFSKELDVSFSKYDDHEKFYLELAGKANLQGWELDRLMYHFSTEILEAINAC